MKKTDASTLDTITQDSPREESFLRRWSQRKLGTATATEEIDVEAQQLETSSGSPASGQSQSELTDEDMPPLDSLDENSDYSVFFSPKVSEALRKQALRKLFHFEKFNVTDGLNDYDEDYTQFENLGNIVTHEMKRLLDSETEKLMAHQSLDEMAEEVSAATYTEKEENNNALDTSKNPTENKVTDS